LDVSGVDTGSWVLVSGSEGGSSWAVFKVVASPEPATLLLLALGLLPLAFFAADRRQRLASHQT